MLSVIIINIFQSIFFSSSLLFEKKKLRVPVMYKKTISLAIAFILLTIQRSCEDSSVEINAENHLDAFVFYKIITSD